MCKHTWPIKLILINIPFWNISSINLHCKEITVPSLIFERLSLTANKISSSIFFSQAWIYSEWLITLNLIQEQREIISSTERSRLHTVWVRTSNIGVREQAVHLYKLGLFESSHPVFCDYITLMLQYMFSCYNKALATFARKWLKLCGVPAIPRGFTFTFTFMHLADAFIQSELQCIQATIFFFFLSVCVFPGTWIFRLCNWQEADVCQTHCRRGESETQLVSVYILY